MHIPDGFINIPTSLGAGAVAAGGLGVAIKRTARTLADPQVLMAALTACFIFAVQMLNFPVAAGTSGHLLGGALAAVLVGPWAGALCLAVVLIGQALFFADGGLTALGLNIVNIALVGTLGGYAVFTGLRKLLPRSRAGVLAAAGAAAFLSVPLAAAAFVVEFALGGTADVPLGEVAAAMIGVHLLIGVGEAVITALALSAVLGARPDLVHGARDLLPTPAASRDARPGTVPGR